MAEKITFQTETFEGPLEVLLHLIAKHKLDIYDIEITDLLQQYMDYINEMKAADLEVASEFLEMAARLVYIKTVSLLPKHEEAEALKRELTGQLLELQHVKYAAGKLEQMKKGYVVFVRKPAPIEVDKTYRLIHNKEVLLEAYEAVAGKAKRNLPPDAEIFSPIVSKKMVSVTSKIVFVLRKLYLENRVKYHQFFQSDERSELVATFLAMLELVKSKRIFLTEDNQYVCFDSGQRARKRSEYGV